jgi:chemotaxis protein histidine kinase CheA
VLELISWKHSFKRLNEESEMARKKKQALDNLLSTGRISQSTYDSFSKEMDEAIAEIERQRNALLEKMGSKMKELEGQIRTLEMLFANYEIQHVAGEVDDEVYQREIGLLSTGLEAARHELDAVNEAVSQLSSGNPSAEQEIEVQVAEEQSPQPEETFLEEPLPAKKEESAEPPAEPTEEAVQCAEEPAEVKAEEKQETQ